MSTVGALVNRVMGEWLRPAGEQPLIAFVNAAVDDTTTSIPVDATSLSVDERGLLSPGVTVEIGRELVLIKDIAISGVVYTLTVVRGWSGTTAASHAQGDPAIVAPDVHRDAVFQAVAMEVLALWPTLWATTTIEVTSDSGYVEVPADVASTESYRWQDGTTWRPGGVRLLRNFTPSNTGKAVQFIDVPKGKTGYLTYRRKFTRPTTEAETLADLGVEDDWHEIIVLGAASRCVAQMDPSRLSVDWVTQTQEAQISAPGTASALARRLRLMREEELADAGKRWKAEHPTVVRMNNPFRPWAGAS